MIELPNIEDQISEETFQEVPKYFEMYLYKRLKQHLNKEDIDDVTEDDLQKAIDIAMGEHEKYEDYVDEKTSQIARLLPIVSISTTGDIGPVRVSLTGLSALLFEKLGDMFSKEVDFRRSFIENISFKQTTDNAKINTFRESWNLIFYDTRNMSRILIACYAYEISERVFKTGIEMGLCRRGGLDSFEIFNEMKAIHLEDQGFTRIEEIEKEYPVT